MSEDMVSDLTQKAKSSLDNAKFDEAVGFASAALALDSSNATAKSILTAADAARGSTNTGSEDGNPSQLQLLAVKVQSDINSREFFRATQSVEEYLKQNPNDFDAQKMLNDVKRAHGEHNTRVGQRQRQRAAESQRRVASREMTKRNNWWFFWWW